MEARDVLLKRVDQVLYKSRRSPVDLKKVYKMIGGLDARVQEV